MSSSRLDPQSSPLAGLKNNDRKPELETGLLSVSLRLASVVLCGQAPVLIKFLSPAIGPRSRSFCLWVNHKYGVSLLFS